MPVDIGDLKALKESSKQLPAKKHKGCASLLIVEEGLSNKAIRRLGTVTVKETKASEEQLMNELKQCATQQGRHGWHVELDCGDRARRPA